MVNQNCSHDRNKQSINNYSDGAHCASHHRLVSSKEEWKYDDNPKKAENGVLFVEKGMNASANSHAFAEGTLTIANDLIMTALSGSKTKANTRHNLKSHCHREKNSINPDSTQQQAQNYHDCPQQQVGTYTTLPTSSLPIQGVPFDLPPCTSRTTSQVVYSPTATSQIYCTKVTPAAPHLVPTTPGNPPSLGSSAAIRGKMSIARPLEHFKTRPFIPLGTPDDSKWLSEFNCFLRAECLEVIIATEEDVRSRMQSQKIKIGQVGIRCRFCAHLTYKERRNGSSVFPSKISTIYQRVTMMVKEHFPRCLEMPSDVRVSYIVLKGQSGRGDIQRSRHYWDESAARIGITNGTSRGLFMTSI